MPVLSPTSYEKISQQQAYDRSAVQPRHDVREILNLNIHWTAAFDQNILIKIPAYIVTTAKIRMIAKVIFFRRRSYLFLFVISDHVPDWRGDKHQQHLLQFEE